MRPFATIRPTATDIENQAKLEDALLKPYIEYRLKNIARGCTSILQLAGLISLADKYGCDELFDRLTAEYQAIIDKKELAELTAICGERGVAA